MGVCGSVFWEDVVYEGLDHAGGTYSPFRFVSFALFHSISDSKYPKSTSDRSY